MSHLLPYIAIGAAVALVIAAFGVWMAWCDLIDSHILWLVRQDTTPCNTSPSANATFNSKWWT